MKSLSRSVGKQMKKAMNSKYFLLVLLVVAVLGYLLYNWCKNGKLEPFSSGATLYFFFADWCPHCTKFKPEWEELKNQNLGVQMEEVDCTDNKNVPALAKEYNVSGFPTLILVNGNENHKYSGNRSASDIASFIKPFAN